MRLQYLLRKYASLVYTILLFLGRFFVLCAIVAGPWKNGGADLLYQRFFLLLALGSGICALGALATAPLEQRKETNLVPGLCVSIPLLLGLALCVLQVAPLSEKTLAKLSPYVLELKEFVTPTLDVEAPSKVAEGQEKTELRTRLSEKVFPLAEDANFNINEALALENSIDQKYLEDVPTWGNTISVYPLATREWTPLFWCGFLFVFSTVVLFNSKKSRSVLFVVAAVVGVSFALTCLMFRANPASREFPLLSVLAIKDSELRLGFGTYVNKNCCGGYLVYCLAPCVFLAGKVLVKSARLIREERERRDEESQGSNPYYEVRKDAMWKVVLGDVFDLFNRRLVFWLCFIVVIFATILVSKSRGAAIAALCAILCAFGVLACKKDARRYWYIFLLIGIATAGVVESVGLTQSVDDRMATLFNEDKNGETAIDRDARLENWRSALETSRDYYWFGSGLGTYSLVNGANDVKTKDGFLFYYAENSFIQNLVEMGRVGCALFIAEYLLLFFCFGRLLWKSRGSEEYAIGAGGLSLLVGQLITSSSDLGIYLSGNLTTFAVLCGAFLSYKRADSRKDKRSKTRSASSNRRRRTETRRFGWIPVGVGAGVLAVCVLSGIVALKENKDYARRYVLLKESKFTAEQYVNLSSTALDPLISSFERYVQTRDDSFEIRARLAELVIARYRLRLLEFLKEQRPDANLEDLWNETALAIRLQSLLKYQEIGFDVAVASIRNNRFAKESVLPAMIHSLRARRICPVSARPYVSTSETVPLTADLSWQENQALIELYARRVALFGKYDSSLLFNSGFYLGAAGLKSLQIEFWRKSLEYDAKRINTVLTLLAAETPSNALKDAVVRVLPDDPLVMASIPRAFGSRLKGAPLYLVAIERGRSYFDSRSEEEKDSFFYSLFFQYFS